MTLTEFVLARIAEDEAAARAASQVRVREADGSYRGLTALSEVESVYVRYRQGDISGHHVEGTALWQMFSPDRVLAECEVKRRIVELHAADWETVTRFAARWGGPVEPLCKCCAGGAGMNAPWPCDTVKALAQPYADHPDYDPRWRI